MNIEMPKIELHCHLDGSLRPETVFNWVKEDKDETYSDINQISNMMIVPNDCDSLITYLERFKLPIKVLQTSERLRRATYELMEDAALEGVKYIEIRFAPELHVNKGMTYSEIISSVIEGIKGAEQKYDIRGNVILSYLRMSSPEGFKKLIDEGKEFLRKGVVAVDLCGGEDSGFAAKFKDEVNYAKALGYDITIHAGETGFDENIIDAIELLGATRIGHGVAMANKPSTREKVIKNNIFVECCPTSNLQTKAILNISEHPIDKYIEEGIKVTMNTDNRTVSSTNMSKEFSLMKDAFKWENSIERKIYLNSIEASFADDDTKKWLETFI